MKKIKIIRHSDNTIIYEGTHPTPQSALEHALKKNLSLSGANLSNLNLSHINLDGADLSHCLIDNTNLTGANLSETNLTGTKIFNSDLTLATLCASTLHETDFTNSSFASTLLTDATLNACHFTCPSALTLPFYEAILTGPNTYHQHIFTAPPIVITGLPKRLVFLDDIIFIGHTPHPRPDFCLPFEDLFKKTV